MRRRALIAAALLAASPAAAQERSVQLISPYSIGAGSYGLLRALGDGMAPVLGQNVVVVQRDGGSGVVGMRALAQSAPDGLTIAYTPMTAIVVQPHLVRNLGLGPESVATVCNVAENILGLVVRAQSPLRDAPQLVAEARRRTLVFGTAGPNSIPFISVHRMKLAAGGEYEHLPFRGDVQPITEVMAGRLDFASIVVASGAEYIRDGQLRLLGVFSNRRHPDFPDVPTLREQGINAEQLSFAGVFAPRATPPAVLDRLEAACRRAVDTEQFRRVAASTGTVVEFRPRAEQARMVAEAHASFGRVLRELGVEPE